MAAVLGRWRAGALFVGVMVGIGCVFGQGDFEEFWEAYVRTMEETEEGSALVYEEDVRQVLRQLVDEPIDLNTAGRSDFEQIPFMDWEAIEAILEYRRRFGPFESVWELNAVRGLGPAQCALLRYVVRVKGGRLLGERKKRAIVRTMHDGQVQGGKILAERSRFQWDGSLGNRSSGHLGMHWPHRGRPWKAWRRGMLLQLRAFGTWQLKGAAMRVYLGDYTVRLGEGLLCYQGFHIGQGIHVLSIVKGRSQKIRPYRSRSNYGFLRGVGVEFRLRPFWKVSAALLMRNMRWYWSRVKPSYWVVGEPLLSQAVGRGLDVATAIVNTSYSNARGSVEANVLLHRFGGAEFPHSWLGGGSVAHRWSMRGVWVYGEAALWTNGEHGLVEGLSWTMGKAVRMSVHYRYMSDRYPMLWVAPIMRGSIPAGERGWFRTGVTGGYVPTWRLYFVYQLQRHHQRQWEYRWSMYYGLGISHEGWPQLAGWMIAQDWRYTSRRGRWRWRGQMALFEIADFQGRMYLYVPGSLGIGRFAAFYGNGAHLLNSLRIKLPRDQQLECLVHWSLRTYRGEERRQLSWQFAWMRRW